MGTPDSEKGQEKLDLANLGPIENLSFDDANVLLCGFLVDDCVAAARLANEPYPPMALIEIARRAGCDTAGTKEDCFSDVDQMTEFASDRMPLPLASIKAMHIASGCTDCGEKFNNFAKAVAPAFEAWSKECGELVSVRLRKSENWQPDLSLEQASFDNRCAKLEQAIAQARSKFEASLAEKPE